MKNVIRHLALIFTASLSMYSYCADCVPTELTLYIDNYGSNSRWTLESGNGSLVAAHNGYHQQQRVIEQLCLEPDSYLLTLFEDYSTDHCCLNARAGYDLHINGRPIAYEAEVNAVQYVNFSVSAEDAINQPDYYGSIGGLDGYELKTALHDVIKTHSDRGYSAVWNFVIANDIDTHYENDSSILDIYSENPSGNDPYNFIPGNNQCGNYSGEGGCYNREHSFPRSWFNDAAPMFSDIHQLFPTDGRVNERRSNFAYGEVGTASFTSGNGSKLGNNISNGYSGTVFEPIDEFKGDIARAQLYMATRYQDQIANWETYNSRGDVVLDGSSNRVYEAWYIDLLIDWHNSDPVSQKERERNDAAYDYQGNRNPFVDNPQWVERIWGDAQ